MDCPMTFSSRRFAPVLVVSTLMLISLGGLALGCGSPVGPGGADGSSGEPSSTGPGVTTFDSADVTVGSITVTDPSISATTASSGDPDTTDGTTQGVSVTDGTTSDGTTSDGTTDGTTSDGTTDGSTSDASTSGSSSDSGGMVLPDISGDFLLALATPLDPTLPLQYIATFDFVPMGMGGTVDVELQPLALDQGSTTMPRTFFGPPLVFMGIPVAADGTFTVDVGPLSVAAETNPIVLLDAQADNVVMNAQILDVDDVCGTVDGDLVAPIAASLAGSTFAAVRVPDTMPASLPVVFPLACP
jgi:hypothetical protein